MDKIWFILVNANEEGPYSIHQLKYHSFFTPDTLVRKEGSKKWIQARYVSDLKEIFEDDSHEAEDDTSDMEYEETLNEPFSDELVIDYRADPPQFYFWLIITLILFIYFLFKIISNGR